MYVNHPVPPSKVETEHFALLAPYGTSQQFDPFASASSSVYFYLLCSVFAFEVVFCPRMLVMRGPELVIGRRFEMHLSDSFARDSAGCWRSGLGARKSFCDSELYYLISDAVRNSSY